MPPIGSNCDLLNLISLLEFRPCRCEEMLRFTPIFARCANAPYDLLSAMGGDKDDGGIGREGGVEASEVARIPRMFLLCNEFAYRILVEPCKRTAYRWYRQQ